MSIYDKNNLAIYDIAEKKNTSRPIFQGILFKPNITVATDSYILIEVKNNPERQNALAKQIPQLPDAKPFLNFPKAGILLPADAIKEIYLKVKNLKNLNLPILENAFFVNSNDEKTSKIATTNLETTDIKTIRKIEGGFPDYQQSIPNDNGIKILLTLSYLKKLIDTLSKMSIKDDNIEMIVKDGLAPLKIKATTENQQEVNAVIMPRKP